MKARCFIWNATRTTFLIGATIIGGLTTGYLFHRLLDRPAKPHSRSVPQLIRGLQKQDSRNDIAWQTLWPKLPGFLTSRFPGLEPVPAVSIRREAGSELIYHGSAAREAMPSLIAALQDPDIQVRSLSIQALTKMGPIARSALSDLSQFLGDDRSALVGPGLDSSRGQAALALAAIAPDEPVVVNLLCAALGDKRPNGSPSPTRFNVLRALEKVATETNAVIPTLMLALKETRAHESRQHAIATTNLSSAQKLSATQAADANASFAAQVVTSLGRVGRHNGEVVPVLVESLTSKDERVCSAAVVALANAGPASGATVSALIKVYQQARDERLGKEMGVQVLPRYVLAPRYVPPPAALNTNQVLPYRSSSGMEQFGMGRPSVYVSGLPDQVLWALGRIGPSAQAAVPFLVEESNNRTNRYRADAALACWHIDRKAQAILPILAEELKGDDSVIRRKVARSLRLIGVEAVLTIAEALKDEDRQVRFAAVESLQALGPAATEAVPMLEQVLKTDSKNSLRIAAATALKQIRPEMAHKWKPELLPRDHGSGSVDSFRSPTGRPGPLPVPNQSR